MNKILLDLTAKMPMKQINLDGIKVGESFDVSIPSRPNEIVGKASLIIEKPYMQRYFAGTFRDGVDLWLHRFLSSDGDRHLHSHPFEFNSVILNGGYKEEFLCDDGKKVVRTWDAKGHINEILESILQDIKSPFNSRPDSFCFLACARKYSTVGVFDWHRIAEVRPDTWSAVLVKKQRLPKWYFKSDDGDLVDMISSPRDWHTRYKVRPESGIAIDDNRVAI